MKSCIEFLRSRHAWRYPSLPAGLTLAEIPSLPRCLGGHIPWSSGPEKFSNQDESRLHKTTLTFDSKPTLRARSRCRESEGSSRCSLPSTVRPFWEGLTREDEGFTPYVLRPAETVRRLGGYRKRYPIQVLGHAELLTLRPRSIRPSHVPSGHPGHPTQGPLRGQDTDMLGPKSTAYRGRG